MEKEQLETMRQEPNNAQRQVAFVDCYLLALCHPDDWTYSEAAFCTLSAYCLRALSASPTLMMIILLRNVARNDGVGEAILTRAKREEAR